MSLKIERIPRTVHYYNVEFSFNDDLHKENHFLELFRMIVKMSHDKEADRYKEIGGRLLFVQDVSFDPASKQVRGKIRAVRGLSPEVLDMSSDVAREVELKENEGFVETTHFILSYKRKRKRMAVEYNHAGAKAHEFESYLRHIGQRVKLQAIVMQRVITDDMLEEVQRRMGRCSELIMEVVRDEVATVKKVDGQLATMLENSRNFLKTDKITIHFGFEIDKQSQSSGVTEFIGNLARAVKHNPLTLKAFSKLRVRAEDSEHRDLMEVFDLIEDKVKSKLRIERKPKSNTLVSTDFYEKVDAEMARLKLI